MNRDGVASHNTDLNGECGIIAEDGLALPPFRRSGSPNKKKTRKQLEENYYIAVAPIGKHIRFYVL